MRKNYLSIHQLDLIFHTEIFQPMHFKLEFKILLHSILKFCAVSASYKKKNKNKFLKEKNLKLKHKKEAKSTP